MAIGGIKMVQALEEIAVDAEEVHSVASQLREIDLSQVDRRLAGKIGDLDFVRGLKEEVIRFLGIAAVGEQDVAPSQRVDEYWHEMILNTGLYAAICAKIGVFIHHMPSESPAHEAYQRTLAIYRKVFGEPNREYWKLDDTSTCIKDIGTCLVHCKGGG